MDYGTDNIFDVMKVEFLLCLLSSIVLSIDVVHFHETKPDCWKCRYIWGWRQKSKKDSDPTSALRFFAGDFCTFWMPDVLLSICCRIMDCWFISDVFPELLHYFLFFWESIFPGAHLQVRTDALSLEMLLQERKQPLWPSWCLGHSEPRLDTIFFNWSSDQSMQY